MIEATAFVSPKWVPQMADTAELMRRIERRPGRGAISLRCIPWKRGSMQASPSFNITAASPAALITPFMSVAWLFRKFL
jgi:hypothetical protein